MAELGERVRSAIAARETLGWDFLGGWEPSDLDLFSRFAFPSEPVPGKITDWLGIRTTPDFLPWVAHLAGQVQSDPPIPDDLMRAEAIEYVAVLDSIERANGSFTFIELGASYAPWSCAVAILCKRRNIGFLIIAVEAAKLWFDLISRHFSENGLDAAANNVTLVNAAVSTSRSQPIYFPKMTTIGDFGAAASSQANDSLERVAACELSDILPETGCDLLHIDIQGSELELISSNRKLLKQRARAIYVGTHSRRIDCGLHSMLSDDKWTLMREHHCTLGVKDGGQYWRNTEATKTSNRRSFVRKNLFFRK